MDILKKFRAENSASESNLSSSQKLAVFGLAILGITTMIFWAIGMKNNIYRPLEPKINGVSNATCPNGNCSGVADQAKSQDTDQDGLSDWDETNIYGTSPYIEDTDSDGIKDGDEITLGTDPNCPAGQDCSGASSVIESNVTTGNTSEDSTMPDSLNLSKEQVEANQDAINQAFTGQADAKTLRELLKKSGMPQDILDQMTDDQIMAAYLSTLESATSNQTGN